MSVYDVTRRETFTNLVDVWGKEIELYSTNQDCVRMLVGNKVDRVSLQTKNYTTPWFSVWLLMKHFYDDYRNLREELAEKKGSL